jgi:hypothetical protein
MLVKKSGQISLQAILGSGKEWTQVVGVDNYTEHAPCITQYQNEVGVGEGIHVGGSS